MDLVSEINKIYGKGTARKLTDKPEPFDFISTSSPALDEALGGGIVKGRVVELFGAEGSGKTTLALHILANCKKTAFIDAEHALSPDYAKRIGVNFKEMFLSQPDSAEQALNIMEYLARSGELELIVLDSVAAMSPLSEVEGDMEDSEMAMRARLMSKAMRKIVPLASKTGTTILLINQIRSNIGGYGSPNVTPGGRGVKFASSQRIELKAGKKEENGMKVKAKVVKNKVSTPYKECEFNLIFGEGISKELSLIERLIKDGTFKKSGVWITYQDYKWQGIETARLELKNNQELYKSLI